MKEELINYLEGYRRANEIVTQERRERLSKLTIEESLREYISLCELAEVAIKDKEMEWYEQKKIELLLKRRKIFSMVEK